MKLKICSYLRDVNAGFDQVLWGLAALKKHGGSHDRELERVERDTGGDQLVHRRRAGAH